MKCKEDEVMWRIREAEHSQLVEQMRRRIAELEIEVMCISRFTSFCLLTVVCRTTEINRHYTSQYIIHKHVYSKYLLCFCCHSIGLYYLELFTFIKGFM